MRRRPFERGRGACSSPRGPVAIEAEMRFDFYAYLVEAEERKRELGLTDETAVTEVLRNKGGARTPRKRVALERMEQRARAAGRKPVRAHF